MKKGSDSLVTKYVYRSINGLWMRVDTTSSSGYTSLTHDFYYIDLIADRYPSFRLTMSKENYELTAWKDKHNNVIVRIINKSTVQTKINF